MPEKTEKKNKCGRPRKDIDAEQVRKLAMMQCPTTEIAAFFDCDEGTIRKRFSDVVTKGREAGKISIRRKQFEVAQSGNVSMLIWLGKQYLGQSDKQDIETNATGPLVIVKGGAA